MQTLILVRHGEVANPNHVVYGDLPGFDLSPTGVLEAHAVGRHLQDTPIDAVVSSPLPRAMHTANAVATRHGLRILVDGRLTEAATYPHWTGLRWSEVETVHREQLSAYLDDATALDATVEPIGHVATRMRSAVADVFCGASRVVVMVGHQDPIQALRLDLSGRPLSELRHDPPRHASATTLVSTDTERWVETSTWTPRAPGDHAK